MNSKDITTEAFIEDFKKNFDDPILEDISVSTRFRDLAEWSSLQALVVVTSFEDNYAVTLSGAELENSETIADLYSIVISKIKS